MKVLILLFCSIFMLSCSKGIEPQKVRIAINPWPGYEFLYLASEKGFYAEHGLNVEIVQLSSLADVQRVYMQGRIDGFGSTVVEAVHVAGMTQQSIDVVLVPDFSNGGDMIIADASIDSMQELKGKTVGAEVVSLGLVVLFFALDKYGMALDDVNVVNVEQLDSEQALKSGQIDAMVTYPPYAIGLKNLPGKRQLFSTAQTPGAVIDVISVRREAIAYDPQWMQKFHAVWQRTLNFAAKHQQEAYAIMAKREGISVEELSAAFTGIEVIPTDRQYEMLQSNQLQENIRNVCAVMKQTGTIKFSCDNINQLLKGHSAH